MSSIHDRVAEHWRREAERYDALPIATLVEVASPGKHPYRALINGYDGEPGSYSYRLAREYESGRFSDFGDRALPAEVEPIAEVAS